MSQLIFWSKPRIIRMSVAMRSKLDTLRLVLLNSQTVASQDRGRDGKRCAAIKLLQDVDYRVRMARTRLKSTE
jgi:hypothetical protein